MRLRSPIKRRGTHAEKWARWQDWNRRVVANRAAFACEGCGQRMRPLEWAHLFGRSNVISEPWASLPELTAALCSSAYGITGCHQSIDRALNPALLKSLRTDAVIRLCQRFGLGLASIIGERSEPIDAVREAIRQLEADGWEFDQDRNQIVKTANEV